MAEKIPNTDHHEVCMYEHAFSAGYKMVLQRLEVLSIALAARPVEDGGNTNQQSHLAATQRNSFKPDRGDGRTGL